MASYASAIQQASPTRVAEMFDSANQHYKAGRLDSARRAYQDVLRNDPRHVDARNNLALAAMHAGNDLLAQVELETLRKVSPGYVPAAVNLTVVYERLGQTEWARAMAAEAAKLRENVPAATFNLAWYKDLDGDRDAARKLLEPLVTLDISPKHKEMLRQVGRQAKKGGSDDHEERDGAEEVGFWKKGLAGVCGGKSAWWARILSIIVFLIGSAIAIAIAAGIGGAQSSDKGAVGFFGGIGVFGFWYLLFWGVPSGGWWWTLAVILTLLGSIISAAAAEDM